MGVTNDACNAVIKTFTSSSGEWQITKALAVENGGHTDGTVNLHNNSLQQQQQALIHITNITILLLAIVIVGCIVLA